MFARMDGLMMDRPLLIRDIAERAERLFPDREIVSRTHTGVERSSYGEVVTRARRLASSLERLGVKRGDRVATFGWNSRRHLELYLAVPSMGAVLHTLNIRLFEEDLRYIVGHAQDKVIFLDASLADVMPRFEGVEREVLMPDADGERDGALDYEQLVAEGDEGFAFPDLDERSAAAMCYTSGTTGRPKGVLYSHRSTVLHSIGANQADGLGISRLDSVMPVVPMFHVNAWGLPYIATNAGARLVLPGPRMTPGDLAELIAAENVTFTAGVPTIWQGMLRLDPAPDLSSLKEIVCGGSAVPEALIRGFDDKFGVPIVQAWGMTETSPLASVSRPGPGAPEEDDEVYKLRATQGRGGPPVDFPVGGGAGGGRAARRLHDRRGGRRRAARPRAVGGERVLRGRLAEGEVRGRLAAHGRRRAARRRLLHQARRPHEGPREVGRRVDLLGRARERRHGAPEGHGGGGRGGRRRPGGGAAGGPRSGPRGGGARRRRAALGPLPAGREGGGPP